MRHLRNVAPACDHFRVGRGPGSARAVERYSAAPSAKLAAGSCLRRRRRRPSTSLTLSPIWSIFPAQWRQFVPNPNRGYVQPVREELARLGIVSAGDRAFLGFSGAPRYFHPRADEDALLLSLELICWYFYFDDPFDDGEIDSAGVSGASLVERMMRVLETGGLPADPSPTERLCQQYRTRARCMAAGRTAPFGRFIARCQDWVRSISPIDRRSLHFQPDLAEYARLRLANVGILPQYALNEIIGGLALDDGFVEMPEVRRFGDLAALVIAYCNDIYSYEREAERSTQLNSLEIRLAQHRLPLHQAFAEQLDDIRSMVREMEENEQALQRGGLIGRASLHEGAASLCRRRDQTRYIEDIKSLVVGNHAWSLDDGRYHSRTSPFRELRLSRTARHRSPGKSASLWATAGA